MAPGPATSARHTEAQGLSVSATRRVGDAAQPGVVDRCDVYPAGARFRLSGGDHRLVQPQGAVLAHHNSLDASFCVDCLEDALREHGRPEVFNGDQGSQFTSHVFTGVLKRERIAISMDGRGRALDNIFVERLWRNVKHEDVYLKGYANMAELMIGLAQYFSFYNEDAYRSLAINTGCVTSSTGSADGRRHTANSYALPSGSGKRLSCRVHSGDVFLSVDEEAARAAPG